MLKYIAKSKVKYINMKLINIRVWKCHCYYCCIFLEESGAAFQGLMLMLYLGAGFDSIKSCTYYSVMLSIVLLKNK